MEEVFYKHETNGEFTGIYAQIEDGKLTITEQDMGEFEKEYWLYRYCPWMRGMATSQISCNNGIDKKASHVPL